jgi:hypothetical protein
MFLLTMPAAFEPPVACPGAAGSRALSTAILEIPRGEVREIGCHQPLAVRCLEGMVWITQEGDSRDHLLSAGQELRLEGLGRVVAEALKASRILVETD